MRKTLIAGAVATVVLAAAGAALADPPPPASDNTAITAQGVLGADYSYSSLNQGLGHANIYGGELGAIVPLGADFGGQVTGGYHRLDFQGSGANDWNIAGTAIWAQPWGRLGANVGYTNANVTGAHANMTNYGVYGEYYAGDAATLGLRGGGATGDASALGFGTGSKTGGYAGGEAIAYATPNLALKGTVGYVGIDGGHQWTAGAHGEYLFSEATPVSGWVGYDYSQIGGGGFSVHANTISVGLKYYFGAGGSLRQHQRTGEDDWGPSTIDLTH